MLAAGAVRLRMVVIPYVIFGVADVLTGAIRGCGSPMRPVVINLLCTCVFRLAWIAAIDTDTMAPTWVYASYPASWLLLLVVLLVCWCRLYRRKSSRISHETERLHKGTPYVKIKSAGS